MVENCSITGLIQCAHTPVHSISLYSLYLQVSQSQWKRTYKPVAASFCSTPPQLLPAKSAQSALVTITTLSWRVAAITKKERSVTIAAAYVLMKYIQIQGKNWSVWMRCIKHYWKDPSRWENRPVSMVLFPIDTRKLYIYLDREHLCGCFSVHLSSINDFIASKSHQQGKRNKVVEVKVKWLCIDLSFSFTVYVVCSVNIGLFLFHFIIFRSSLDAQNPRSNLSASLQVILVELEEISPAQLALFPESVRHMRKKQGAVCLWKNLKTRKRWRTCTSSREEQRDGHDTQLSPSLSPSSRFWKEMRYHMPVRGKRAVYPEKTALLNLWWGWTMLTVGSREDLVSALHVHHGKCAHSETIQKYHVAIKTHEVYTPSQGYSTGERGLAQIPPVCFSARRIFLIAKVSNCKLVPESWRMLCMEV